MKISAQISSLWQWPWHFCKENASWGSRGQSRSLAEWALFEGKKKKVYREHPRVWGKRLWICPLILNSAAAKSLQSCPTLCNPIDGSPPGSAVPGILQARMLEWVPIAFSNAWKWKVKVKSLSHIQLFATPWTSAYQAPLYMGFSRQEYWSGVPLPSLNSELYLCEFKHRNT